MGAEPYWYFVKYQPDVNAALQELRRREFEAGRYFPAMLLPSSLFPLGPHSPSPGAQHESVEDAIEEAEASGTASILDLDRVSDEPDYGAVTPLAESMLEELYGTTRPTREMIEQNMDFFEEIERGQGIYTVAYKDGVPDELFFAGYSYD
jgi:hypothetical protein